MRKRLPWMMQLPEHLAQELWQNMEVFEEKEPVSVLIGAAFLVQIDACSDQSHTEAKPRLKINPGPSAGIVVCSPKRSGSFTQFLQALFCIFTNPVLGALNTITNV